MQLEIDAMIALTNGKKKSAVSSMREAVAMSGKLPFKYGPPRLAKPTNELLGDVLAEIGDNELASQAYQAELINSLRRTNSLLGLARTAAEYGDQSTAREAYRVLSEIWHDAYPAHSMAHEARGAMGMPDIGKRN